MNAEEASLLWNRKDDVEQAGGHAAHRQLALKHLKLKTVIKVTCGTLTPPAFLCMFPTPEEPTAVSASTRLITPMAKAQLTVNGAGKPLFASAPLSLQLHR